MGANDRDFGKIAFGVRTSRIDYEFFKCWQRFIGSGQLRAGDVLLEPAGGLPHHWAAETLVHQFMHNTKCDTLMLLDDDMTWLKGDITHFRDNVDNFPYDIVQGLACSRKPPHAPLVLKAGTRPGRFYAAPPRGGWWKLRGVLERLWVPQWVLSMLRGPLPKTIEVGMVGFAFTMIRRITATEVRAATPNDHMLFYFDRNGQGEDARFCVEARKHGFRVGVDCTVKVRHRFPISFMYNPEIGETQYEMCHNRPFLDVLKKMKERRKQEE